jgi:hypothetical protein
MTNFSFSVRKHFSGFVWPTFRALAFLSLLLQSALVSMPARAAEPIASRADTNSNRACISTDPSDPSFSWSYCTGQSQPFLDPSGNPIPDINGDGKSDSVDIATLISNHCQLEAWCDGQQNPDGSLLKGHTAELSWAETQILFDAAEIETHVPARLLKAIAYGEGIATDYSDQMPRQFLNLCKDDTNTNYKQTHVDINGNCTNQNDVRLNQNGQCTVDLWIQSDLLNHRCFVALNLIDKSVSPSSHLVQDSYGQPIMPTLGIDRTEDPNNPGTFIITSYGLGIMQVTADSPSIINALKAVKADPTSQNPVQVYGGGQPGGNWCNCPEIKIDVLQAIRDPYYNILIAAKLLEHKRLMYTNNNYEYCDDKKCTTTTKSRVITFGIDPLTSAPIASLSTDFPNNDYD